MHDGSLYLVVVTMTVNPESLDYTYDLFWDSVSWMNIGEIYKQTWHLVVKFKKKKSSAFLFKYAATRIKINSQDNIARQ